MASIANLRQLQNAAKLVWQTLLWFAITALIAVSIGIALGLIIQPGVHTAVTDAAAHAPNSSGTWLDFLILERCPGRHSPAPQLRPGSVPPR